MNYRKTIILFLILISTLLGCSGDLQDLPDIQKIIEGQTSTRPVNSVDLKTANNTITIASWNIQVFGKTKASKPKVMEVIAKTITEFDIVAIQEIRDKSGTAIKELEQQVDALGTDYDVIIGPRLGRTTSKEQYAYIYRTDKFELIDKYTFPEYVELGKDVFHREPYIAYFKTKSGNFDFKMVNIHVDPEEAVTEIDALHKVAEYARYETNDIEGNVLEKDILLLGDMNSDCSYWDENYQASPLKDKRYKWIIYNFEDTNLAKSSCTYDRIITTTATTEDWTGTAGVYRFDQKFNLNPTQAKAVSDHYPVYAEFYIGKDGD